MQSSDSHGKPATEDRILAAAAALFGRLGYNGVSTRDIATAAEVNEVTIYRHYPRKRDLYVAVLAAELGRVSLRGDLLCEIAQAADARTALSRAFEIISATVMREPELLRLVLYSSLELSADLDVLLRRHLGELVEVISRYLEPWILRGDLRCASARGLILALISIVVFHRPLYRAFFAEPANPDLAFEAFAELCLSRNDPPSPNGAAGAVSKDESTKLA